MKRVLVPFTTGVEEIELVAVVDILRRADIHVVLASFDGQMVTGRSNIKLQADATLEDTMHQDWDMIVLPGGLPNAQLLRESEMVQHIVCQQAEQGKTVAAICAAPVALASFGLTAHKQVTSYPSFAEEMKCLQPTSIYLNQAIVEDGNMITSRGAGTAIDFALYLVATLTNADTAQKIRTSIVA